MDTKKTIEAAIKRYVEKNTESTKKHRKNDKPEKRVEIEVVKALRAIGWFVNVVDSSNWGMESHRQHARAGFADLTGSTPEGRSFFIELKAKGKLKTLRAAQYLFLIEAIDRNAFACVVDSAELLQQIYSEYIQKSNDEKREYLKSILHKPKELARDDEPLFGD